LPEARRSGYILNTFKMTTKRDETRDHLLDTALRLFRRKGFDATTMRDVAEAASMSVGAAYYHFRSKEDLVLAFYRWTQDEHERLLRERLAGVTEPVDRVRIALHTKLQLIEKSRPFLGALFRFTGDPKHPLSVFGPKTRDLRQRAIATFALALEGAGLTGDALRLANTGLWAVHLALILHAVHDVSPGMKKTYALADAAAMIVGRLALLAGSPAAEPTVAWLVEALAVLGQQEEPADAPKTRKPRRDP
jgi:AcrR family transcriptional regulator